jgi:hypothetical protein
MYSLNKMQISQEHLKLLRREVTENIKRSMPWVDGQLLKILVRERCREIVCDVDMEAYTREMKKEQEELDFS